MSAGTGTLGRRIAGVLACLVTFGIIFIGGMRTGDAVPSLGPGATSLPPGNTVASVIDGMSSGAFGSAMATSFDSTGWDTVTLSGGTYLRTPNATTVAASAVVADSPLSWDVVVHAEDDAQGLIVTLRASDGAGVTLGRVVPLLDGTAAADLSGSTVGLSVMQGNGSTLDLDELPGDAGSFVTDVTAGAAVDSSIGVHLAMQATPGAQWASMTEIIGANGAATLDVTGTVAMTWTDVAAMQGNAANFDQIDDLALTYTTAATAPTWSPGAGFSIGLDAGASAWTFDTNYNQADQRVQTSVTGPSWTVTVPVLAPGGISFAPDAFFAEGIGPNPSPLEIGVGGSLGGWQVPGTTRTLELSANFRAQGDTFIADFYAELADPGGGPPTVSFDVYPTLVDGEWSLTLTGTAADLTLAGLADVFDITIDPAVPNGFRTVGLRDTTVVLEFAETNPGGFQFGVTSTLSVSPFGGAAVGISLMGFADVGTAGTELMVGAAPSVQPIGGRGGADPLVDVMLSDILPDAAGDSDLVIFDADDPTTGLGVIWSSATNRIGGEPCLVDPGNDPCPDDKEAQYVPVNVAQWLMPLFGYDGSDAALADSTEAAGACQICSFRKDDFQPATPFTVTAGLTAAGSLVLPNPIGSDLATVDIACAADASSTDCTSALGLLGSIGLDSRVTVSGTLPLAGEDAGGIDLKLALGLLDSPAVPRPTWLHDAGLRLEMSIDPADGFSLSLVGNLQVAIKQGFSAAEADALFGAGAPAATANTLRPLAAGASCPRGGIEKVEPDASAGFTAGATYCHDLLNLQATGRIDAGPSGTSVEFVGDLQSVTGDGVVAPRVGTAVPNPAGWSPFGFDRIALQQVTVTLAVEAKAAGGTSVALGGALSATINTSDPIQFAGAVQISVKPNLVVLDGLRLNVGQISLDNLVEIYEWISGEVVPDLELPGIALRNVAINVGTDRLPALCIEQGFRLSGDLYIAQDLADAAAPAIRCIPDPNNAEVGQLDPAPAAPCGPDEIAAGCRAGIRLVINELGLTGDAFMAAFDAGPVHVYQPATGAVIPPDQAGRGVSLKLEINSTGVSAHIFGGAALGGSAAPASCAGGPYCDAWASGEFNARLTAGINGANLKLYGKVQSGLPGLSFRMLAAGEATVPGVDEMIGLFERGEIPDAGFRLHVELANADAAPELDFAARFQSQINADLGEIADGLRDLRNIVDALRRNDTSRARTLLAEYDSDADIETLIDVIAAVRAGAAEAERSGTLDFLLNGEHFGLPGLVTRNLDGDRVCGWPQWGFGSVGSRTVSTTSYSRGFCFLIKPFYVPGACDVLLDRPSCTVDDLANEIVVEPILDSVIASIDIAIDSVEFAQNASEFVLSGQVFSVQCVSFDWVRGVFDDLGAGAQESVQFGLFVTLFGQDIGTSFGWSFDTSTPVEDQLVNNLEALGASLVNIGSNDTPTTCWSAAELARFFGNEIAPPGAAPPPAQLRSLVIDEPGAGGQNLAREGATATATLTWDAPISDSRTVTISWGDGTTGTVTAPAGASTITTTKVWDDDGLSPAATESVQVDATDTSTGQTVAVAVTLFNVDPTLQLSVAPDPIDENESATLTITVIDPGSVDTHDLVIEWGDGERETVTVAPAQRTVTRTHQYLQNPLDEVAEVTVEVVDKDRGTGAAETELGVNNVAPVVTSITPTVVDEGVDVDYRIEWSDPGTLDGHQLAIRWDDRVPGLDPDGRPLVDEIWTVAGGRVIVDLADDGLAGNDADQQPDRVIDLPAGPVRSLTVPHRYLDDDPTATPFDTVSVRVDITDVPDGDATTTAFAVQVNDVAPVASIDLDQQTVQYSDEIDTVTVTATDVAADLLHATATVASPIDPLAVLPAGGLWLSAPSCVPADDQRQACAWTLDGIVDLPAGEWTVEIVIHDDDTLTDTVSTTIVVLPEDAEVAFPASNPVDVQVPEAAGPSGDFTLQVEVTERIPDEAPFGAHPGDVARAEVRMTLEPVAPGLASHTVDCVASSSDPVADGYDQLLIVDCDFDGIPVGAYWARADVHGRYWTGTGESVVTVSDPSLGHVTAGGRFAWDIPGTVQLQLTADYVGRASPRPRGHLRVDPVGNGALDSWVDSTSITAIAIGEHDGTPWATVTALAEVSIPGEPQRENWIVVLHVEDNGNGSRIDDVWIELRAPGAVEADPWSMLRLPVDEAVRMSQGSLQIH